jgi:GMP synthase-like glutamine amidotransferase
MVPLARSGIVGIAGTIRPMRAVSIESDENCPPGHIGAAAQAAGYDIDHVVVNCQVEAFGDPSGIDLLLITGSDEHWYQIDEHPHLQAELAFIRAAMANGARVFGMCFGGQALSLALGGSVTRNERDEIGWVTVETNDPALIPAGPWFAWHSDGFTVPDGGRLVAWNEFGAHAFVHGPHLGLQFHSELEPAMLDRWKAELPEIVDGPALVQETADRADDARRRAFALFDAFERMGVRT